MDGQMPKSRFQADVTFDDALILRLFRTAFYLFERRLMLMRLLLALAALAAALFAGVPRAVKGVSLFIGVWLMAAMDFPSRVRAERVISARKGRTSTVHLAFYENNVAVTGGKPLVYSAVKALREDDKYLYVFENRHNAVVVDKRRVTGGDAEALKQFLQRKTGQAFSQRKSLWQLTIYDIFPKKGKR